MKQLSYATTRAYEAAHSSQKTTFSHSTLGVNATKQQTPIAQLKMMLWFVLLTAYDAAC
jgi:hypothetical protein